MTPVLVTHQLTKTFSHPKSKRHAKIKNAVDHVEMTIHRGDIYGLVGQNGAGKTTLMRLISGLMLPTEGTLELFGSTDLNQHRRRTGCLIEAPGLQLNMSAYDNLEAHRRLLGLTNPKVINETLKSVSLENTPKKVKYFSMGMRKRLGIALSLLGHPDFLILDEPASGLDPQGRLEIRQLLARLNLEKGLTILISSHILGDLSKFATRYGILREGCLVDQFSADTLKTQCRRCLKIKVDHVKKAALLIETLFGTTNYDVLPDQTIRLFDCLDQSALVNRELNQNGILVESIAISGQDIEAYFMEMMKGNSYD